LLLPIAQLAYNNKLLELTRKTPFFANYRQHLNLFKRTLLGPKAQAALTTATNLQEIYEEIRQKMAKS
jgi:hypothetical protein